MEKKQKKIFFAFRSSERSELQVHRFLARQEYKIQIWQLDFPPI